MKYTIIHQTSTRLRLNAFWLHSKMVNGLIQDLTKQPGVLKAKASYRTASITINFKDQSEQENVLKFLDSYVLKKDYSNVPEKEKNESFFKLTAMHFLKRLLPMPIRQFLTIKAYIPFLITGLSTLRQKKLKIELLDATAIGVSIASNDFGSASNIMYLLEAGDILADWTRKKSLESLADSLALNVEEVWIQEKNGSEKLIKFEELQKGDTIIIRAGSVIPIDGLVTQGEASINESSLTGEPLAVLRKKGNSVYAGTSCEEGEIYVEVKSKDTETKMAKVLDFIDDSEKHKAAIQSKAESMADAMVPYSFGISLITYLLTRNWMKASAALLVDFSCAIKLATPLAILSSMKNGTEHGVVFKGGHSLESLAEAKIMVFDKTGTLTQAQPQVADIITLNGYNQNDILKIAACLEEHFPHPVANAVVGEAKARGIIHGEEHAKVHYIAAHGIVSELNGKKIVIGSRHFIYEDENIEITEEVQQLEDKATYEGLSILYIAISGKLAALICIKDPIREEAPEILKDLKKLGVVKNIMITGDSKKTAARVAQTLGLDAYFAQTLPNHKADLVKKLKQSGYKVVMVGDGINDSPALSAADAGVAMSDGTTLAREVADITLESNSLWSLITARWIAQRTIKRINHNYKAIIGINGSLLILGIFGAVTPGFSALIHNFSTLVISLLCLRPVVPKNLLLDKKESKGNNKS